MPVDEHSLLSRVVSNPTQYGVRQLQLLAVDGLVPQINLLRLDAVLVQLVLEPVDHMLGVVAEGRVPAHARMLSVSDRHCHRD